MGEPKERDVDYTFDGVHMIGRLCAPEHARCLPSIVLVHDAFGLGDEMLARARRLTALGFTVLAADVWGERRTPADESQIGPLIGGMARDRRTWLGRIGAAHEALVAQAEADGRATAIMGYCFGGSSALEFVRTGGDVRGAVSIHGGLDLLGHDWSAATRDARILLCSGAEDPMADRAMRDDLTTALSGAGIGWELDLYSDTRHAFTVPSAGDSSMGGAAAYNPRSAARARVATERFLRELFEGSPEAD